MEPVKQPHDLTVDEVTQLIPQKGCKLFARVLRRFGMLTSHCQPKWTTLPSCVPPQKVGQISNHVPRCFGMSTSDALPNCSTPPSCLWPIFIVSVVLAGAIGQQCTDMTALKHDPCPISFLPLVSTNHSYYVAIRALTIVLNILLAVMLANYSAFMTEVAANELKTVIDQDKLTRRVRLMVGIIVAVEAFYAMSAFRTLLNPRLAYTTCSALMLGPMLAAALAMLIVPWLAGTSIQYCFRGVCESWPHFRQPRGFSPLNDDHDGAVPEDKTDIARPACGKVHEGKTDIASPACGKIRCKTFCCSIWLSMVVVLGLSLPKAILSMPELDFPEHLLRPPALPPLPPPAAPYSCDCQWTSSYPCPGTSISFWQRYAKDDGSACFGHCCPTSHTILPHGRKTLFLVTGAAVTTVATVEAAGGATAGEAIISSLGVLLAPAVLAGAERLRQCSHAAFCTRRSVAFAVIGEGSEHHHHRTGSVWDRSVYPRYCGGAKHQ